MTKIYGLIGKKLTHSFSPKYFNKKFEELQIDARYTLFELENINQFPELITANTDIAGLNVTIPYKQEIIRYLDDVDEIASQINSVNTIQFIKNENKHFLKGFNTDVIGFEKTLLSLLNGKLDLRALVLGTGGSAASVFYVLKKQNIPFVAVSRHPTEQGEISYEDLNKEIIQDNKLIVNTTPVGMFPKLTECPSVPYHYLGEGHFLYDLVYNPLETEFLKNGKNQGAQILNGLQMLQVQANESWKIWNMV